MYGHNGKIMWVDLTKREIKEEPYDETFARMFLEGNGLAAKMIHDRVPPDIQPLDPGNAIAFSVGPLTGAPLNKETAKALNSVTGWDVSLQEFEKIGERIYNLERLISVRRGLSRKDDTLPYRVMNEPIPDGPAKGRLCPQERLDSMLDAYYALRGWTPDGIPTDGKLSELGLK